MITPALPVAGVLFKVYLYILFGHYLLLSAKAFFVEPKGAQSSGCFSCHEPV